MSSLRALVCLLALGLVAPACGGAGGTAAPGSPGAATAVAAPLAAPLAASLATEADAVVAGLDAGDTCEAAKRADDLLNAIRDAISAGELTGPAGASLLQVGEQLQDQINCPSSGKGGGKGKKNDKDD